LADHGRVPVRQALEQAQGEVKESIEAGGRVAADGKITGPLNAHH
jgi:hypothetical protein